MDAREKLNEYAELQGWNKNKLIGWSEAADFGEWLLKNYAISDAVGQTERLKTFAEYAQERMWEVGDYDLIDLVDEFEQIMI